MLDTLSAISSSDRYNEWIYQQFKEDLCGRVLDVGSGIGDIGKYYIRSNVSKVFLTDHSEEMVVRLKERFGRLRDVFEVIRMDIVDDTWEKFFPKGSMDAITCSNVLEHIEDDLAVLIKIKSMLCKGGKLLLLVPALPQIYGTLDALVGHHRRYTRKGLVRTLEKAGFVVERQHYMNIFGVVTWFVAGRMLRCRKFSSVVCRALDRFVPVLRQFERYGSPPFGQSLVMICTKP